MRVKNLSSNSKIDTCVDFINELLSDDEIYEEISSQNHFDYTDLNAKAISSIIKMDKSIVEIKLYKSRWRWSKANGYVSRNYPNTLFLNTRKLWRSEDSIINTIVHECVHVADFNDNGTIDFGHGDNKSIGKENSAPYWIGSRAGELYKDVKTGDVEIESVEIETERILN